MNFQEFLRVVKSEIEGKFDKEYSISYNHVVKNNGLELEGLVIFKEGETVVPNIYVNEYYDMYKKTGDINFVISKIIEMYETALTSNFVNDFSIDYTFDNMKDKIYYRIVNYEKNIKLLNDIPHKKFLDMVIAFYCLIDTTTDGIASIRITNDHLEKWKINKYDVLDIAMKNTPRIFPGVIRSMKDVIKDLILKSSLDNVFSDGDEYDTSFNESGNVYYFNKNEKLDEDIIEEMLHRLTYDKNCDMYVLSNKTGLNGASAMLYNGLIEQFAEKVNSNLYILPSSIHEVILMPYNEEYEIEELKKMVKEINSTQVPKGDVLSDSVYIYQRKECALSY